MATSDDKKMKEEKLMRTQKMKIWNSSVNIRMTLI